MHKLYLRTLYYCKIKLNYLQCKVYVNLDNYSLMLSILGLTKTSLSNDKYITYNAHTLKY